MAAGKPASAPPAPEAPILADAPEPDHIELFAPDPDPNPVYVTTVGYPGSVLLLFHADGRVTWK